MPEFCTCGAQLPPDALFCHKCGKPQREIPTAPVEPPAQGPVEPVSVAAAPPPVPSFRNPGAVRSAALAACVSLPLCWIPFFNVLVWVGAGVLSVYFYRRRTGRGLDWRNGLRIGWMTGLVMFVLLTLLFTLSVLVISAAGGPAAIQQQLPNMPMYNEQSAEAVRRLFTVSGIVEALFLTFVSTTLLCGAGGALGSRLVSRT